MKRSMNTRSLATSTILTSLRSSADAFLKVLAAHNAMRRQVLAAAGVLALIPPTTPNGLQRTLKLALSIWPPKLGQQRAISTACRALLSMVAPSACALLIIWLH